MRGFQEAKMRQFIKSYLGNIVYTILVIPSFLYFATADSTDQFAALFLVVVASPWSLVGALCIGILNASGLSRIDIPDSIYARGLILLSFVILNEFIIYRLSVRRQKNKMKKE